MGLFGSRGEPSRARTAQEREAARRAREAERAARRGDPPPVFDEPVDPATPAPPEEPVAAPRPEPAPPRREEPVAAPRPEPPVAAPRPEPPAPPSPRREPGGVPEPVARFAAAPRQHAPEVSQQTATWEAAQEDHPEAWNEPDMDHGQAHHADRDREPEPWDRPAPYVPLPWEPPPAVGEEDEPAASPPRGRFAVRPAGHGPASLPPSPARRDAPGWLPDATAKGGRRLRGRRPIALALFLAPVLAALWFLVSLFQPLGGKGEGTVAVTIPEGASVARIGDILAEEGVVDSGFFFRLRAMVSGESAALRSGPHELREGMSYAAAIDALSTPPPAAGTGVVVDVTLPEGLSRSEIAPIVEKAGVEGDYAEAARAQKGFSPEEDYGAPEDTPSLEGFLFPSTYELRVEDNAEDLVSKQLEALQENIRKVDMSRAEKRNLTRYEVLIIASMVERETRVPEERSLVAAVIYNRLSEGMPLGIDATIRYANDNWDSPLKRSELEKDGPYNTRTRTGLPPTPIGNPGLDSIRAAANPADEDFLYYVVKPGTCGKHNFSATDVQFQRDVAAYNRARDATGGKSPTTC